MMVYISVVITLHLITFWVYIYAQGVFIFDHKRVAGIIAARFIDLFENSSEMSKAGATEYARKQYLEMSAVFGFPVAATRRVVSAVLLYITEQRPEVSFND